MRLRGCGAGTRLRPPLGGTPVAPRDRGRSARGAGGRGRGVGSGRAGLRRPVPGRGWGGDAGRVCAAGGGRGTRAGEQAVGISSTPEFEEQSLINLREQAYTALQACIPASLTKHAVQLRVVVGQPFARILETAVREHIAMIILGTYGRTGLAHLVMGSVAERIIRLAPCPVLTVKAGTTEEHSWLQRLYDTFLTP